MHAHGDHGHHHVFLGEAHEANERRTLWVVGVTAVMMVGEIAAGWIFGSMALLADGFHMATHALALGVAAAAYVYARKQAHNDRYTFGTGKVGELAGFASALALGLIALGIGAESAQRLAHPHHVAFTEATLVAILGLAVNLASALMLSGGHHHHHGHGHDHHDHDHDHEHDHEHEHEHEHGHAHARPDNNLRSAYVHVLADAVTSVLAIVALLGGRFLGWVWLDAVMGIVGAVVIANWSWSLLRDTSGVLLDTADARLARTIRERIEADGDARVTDLHVWQVGPGVQAAIVALIAAEPLQPSAYKARLEGLPVGHVTIEASRCEDGHAPVRAAA
jgi:cation diffusion facilitator family transporter